MSRSFKVFAVKEDESIIGISEKKLEDLLSAKDGVTIPDFSNKKIRIACFYFTTENRKITSIMKSEFLYLDFNSQGMLNMEKKSERLKAAIEKLDPQESCNDNSNEQFVWQPSEDLLNKLHVKLFNKL